MVIISHKNCEHVFHTNIVVYTTVCNQLDKDLTSIVLVYDTLVSWKVS
jgi:hypothetical protein